MNSEYNNSERGQAIVYLVLGLVVFLGFVAIAIDGGMALADRRHSQNAADAASLAGGGRAAQVLESAPFVCISSWTCSEGGDAMAHAEIEARDRADANGFDLNQGIANHSGYEATCNSSGKYIDVTVAISATTTSNFLQLVFPSALHNEVESVTRVHPSQPIGLDGAVIGLNPAACGGKSGVIVSGTADTLVDGGDIFSNGCIRGNGASGTAKVVNGNVEGHYLDPGNLTWDPAPGLTDQTIQPSDYLIDPPEVNASGDCVEGTTVNNLPNNLSGGLWCVKGNLNINHDTSLAVADEGVTIYMLDGHIFYNGNSAVNLSAPTTTANGGIPGILFFVPNGQAVTINGTSDDHFNGLIYAPKSDIKLTGNANNIYNGQVIGWNVEIGGTDSMDVYYDECSGYQRPSFIELYR